MIRGRTRRATDAVAARANMDRSSNDAHTCPCARRSFFGRKPSCRAAGAFSTPFRYVKYTITMPTPTTYDLARLAETQPPPSGFDDASVRHAKKENRNALNGTERRWRWYQPWLEEHGYLLRPRYRPGWEPPADRFFSKEDCMEQTVRARTRHPHQSVR